MRPKSRATIWRRCTQKPEPKLNSCEPDWQNAAENKTQLQSNRGTLAKTQGARLVPEWRCCIVPACQKQSANTKRRQRISKLSTHNRSASKLPHRTYCMNCCCVALATFQEESPSFGSFSPAVLLFVDLPACSFAFVASLSALGRFQRAGRVAQHIAAQLAGPRPLSLCA